MSSLEEIEVAFVDDSAFLAWGRVARGLVGEPEAQGAGGVAGAELYDLRRVAKAQRASGDSPVRGYVAGGLRGVEP